LESIGISYSQAVDIYNKFYIEYQKLVDFFLIFFRYKTDFFQELSLLQQTRILDIQDNDSNNLGIYI
jgi:hypothetical protein